MAVGHINIGKHQFTFVFRHRFEGHGDDTVDKFRANMAWRSWELGLWYKRTKIVGQNDFKTPKKWKHNMVRSHMFGINLLICKAWVEYNKGGMNIPEK
jgi:hypothetical protein